MTSPQIVCVGNSLALSLEPLAYHRHVASLSLFYSYDVGKCSTELAELVPHPYSCGSSSRYSNRLHVFSVTSRRNFKNVYVKNFFPGTTRIWNSLPPGYVPLVYEFNCFMSRVNRHLASLGSFSTAFLCDFHLFLLLLVTPFFVVTVQFFMEWNPIKKIVLSPSFISCRIIVLHYLKLIWLCGLERVYFILSANWLKCSKLTIKTTERRFLRSQLYFIKIKHFCHIDLI